jgi:hypothetical protein
MDEPPTPPVKRATTADQLASIAELPKLRKYAIFELLSENNYAPYHQVSCYPITVTAENDMVGCKTMFMLGNFVVITLTPNTIVAGIAVGYNNVGRDVSESLAGRNVHVFTV